MYRSARTAGVLVVELVEKVGEDTANTNISIEWILRLVRIRVAAGTNIRTIESTAMSSPTGAGKNSTSSAHPSEPPSVPPTVGT